MIAILFIASLFACALLGLPMLYAILAGLVMFFVQGLRRGIPARRLFAATIPGFRKSLIVVVVICLIGIMSAAWRNSGLMALLVVKGLSLIYPPLFLLFTFLLCSAFAFALGSSIGAASVMGVLLITIGNAARVNPLFTSVVPFAISAIAYALLSMAAPFEADLPLHRRFGERRADKSDRMLAEPGRFPAGASSRRSLP